MDYLDVAQEQETKQREAAIARAIKKQVGTDECLDCRELISAERKLALPTANRCITCQEKKEA